MQQHVVDAIQVSHVTAGEPKTTLHRCSRGTGASPKLMESGGASRIEVGAPDLFQMVEFRHKLR